MIKRFKSAILILIHLLFLQGVYGQAPVKMTDYLSQKFLRYCKSVPREEIFLHSDKEDYIAGEDLWFNIYLIDRQSFKPSLNSRIVYLELLNPENRPVVQKRILIDKGFGPGQITIPDTLSTGTYSIRAYTSWMKNFLPYNCFAKDIKIYNALKTRISYGYPVQAKNIEIGTDSGINEAVKNKRLNLKVNHSRSDNLGILITSDKNYRTENNDLFWIFIQTHGNIDHVSAEKISGDTTTIIIPKAEISSGINQITIFDSRGEPVGERLIYTSPAEKNLLTLHSADSFDVRNKISVEIETGKNISAASDSINLSISVAPQSKDQEIINLNDYMVFGTEYGPEPWEKIRRRNIDDLPAETIDSLLLNLRSNWINWETILSGDVPHFKYQIEKEEHFLLGKLLTGDQKATRPSEIVLLCTPGKEAGFQYTRTDNEGNFSFSIHIDEELKDLIIMPEDVNKNYHVIMESSFSDQYINSDMHVDSIKGQVSPIISKWGVNYQVRKIYGIIDRQGPVDPVYPPITPLRFYGKPDIELIMADYIKLPVMEEVFFEFLPHVSLKKKKSNYEVFITDRIDNAPYIISPCLMIDGVIIKDPSLIINLDPEIVEKIDVVKEKYYVGKYPFPGLINVITKSGDFSCVPLPDYMIRLPYRVIEPLWSFVPPDYSSAEMKNSRIPDYRNTLYWNSSLKPDKDGKARIEFWSSDNKSDYVINVQGISREGKTVSQKKMIKVK
jgi:hypothetical protein